MLASAKSCAVVGLDGIVVDVEVDISPGLPRFDVVGLPDTAVQEARARVRAAIRNSGCEFPLRRITANLAPADVRKAGSSYDLPLAIALLQSSGQLETVSKDAMFVGQLSLNGDLLHTDGILPMVALAKESGASRVFVPMPDGEEAALVEGIDVYPVGRLVSLIRHLRGEEELSVLAPDGRAQRSKQPGIRVRHFQHSRTGARQAGTGGCRCRRSQRAHDWASRFRQDSIGPRTAIHLAASDPLRGDRSYQDLFDCRLSERKITRSFLRGLSDLRTTRSLMLDSWAEAPCPARGKSR